MVATMTGMSPFIHACWTRLRSRSWQDIGMLRGDARGNEVDKGGWGSTLLPRLAIEQRRLWREITRAFVEEELPTLNFLVHYTNGDTLFFLQQWLSNKEGGGEGDRGSKSPHVHWSRDRKKCSTFRGKRL